MMRHDDCLKLLARHVGDAIVIAVYGTAVDWDAIAPRTLNYFSTGAMGLAASHGLGLALGRPDKRVVVIDGDGSLLMSLGSLVTVAAAGPRNFVHLLWHNGTYQANGAHPLPGGERADFVGLARAAGYRAVHAFDDLAALQARIDAVLRAEGPVFADLRIDAGPPQKRDYKHVHSAELRETFRAALNPPPCPRRAPP
jgi:phosphonopyruvate decarboxylase